MTLQPSCLTSLQQYGGGSSIPPPSYSFHPPSVFAACCVFQVYFFLLLDIFQLSAQPDGYFSWPYVSPSSPHNIHTHTHTHRNLYTQRKEEKIQLQLLRYLMHRRGEKIPIRRTINKVTRIVFFPSSSLSFGISFLFFVVALLYSGRLSSQLKCFFFPFFFFFGGKISNEVFRK